MFFFVCCHCYVYILYFGNCTNQATIEKSKSPQETSIKAALNILIGLLISRTHCYKMYFFNPRQDICEKMSVVFNILRCIKKNPNQNRRTFSAVHFVSPFLRCCFRKQKQTFQLKECFLYTLTLISEGLYRDHQCPLSLIPHSFPIPECTGGLQQGPVGLQSESQPLKGPHILRPGGNQGPQREGSVPQETRGRYANWSGLILLHRKYVRNEPQRVYKIHQVWPN